MILSAIKLLIASFTTGFIANFIRNSPLYVYIRQAFRKTMNKRLLLIYIQYNNSEVRVFKVDRFIILINSLRPSERSHMLPNGRAIS